MSTAHTSTIPAIIEAWNTRDAEQVARMYAPDGVRHQYAHPAVRLEGHQEIAQGVKAIFDAFPDSRLELRGVHESSTETVTVEWTWTGTQTADLPGLPARGKFLRLEGISVCAMAGDLIQEERVYWDNAEHLAAQGLLG